MRGNFGNHVNEEATLNKKININLIISFVSAALSSSKENRLTTFLKDQNI